MLRHFAKPFDTAVLHRRIGIESFGHGMGNQCRALFLKNFNQLLLLDDELIYFGGFAVDKKSNDRLFLFWRCSKHQIFNRIFSQSVTGHSRCFDVKHRTDKIAFK